MHIKSFNIERYRRLESRAEQLSAASILASDLYRSEGLELRERQKRLEKATIPFGSSRHPDSAYDAELSALERDVTTARERFELADAERVKSRGRWHEAATLYRACKDYLLEHGIADPDSRHDETRARGLAPAGSGIEVGR